MNITTDEKDGTSIVRLEGRLDAATSAEVERELSSLVESKKEKILLDFDKVEYLSSAGMRLLLSMSKKIKSAGGQLVLFSIHDDVMEIIRMAGFESILSIHPDEQRALENSQ